MREHSRLLTAAELKIARERLGLTPERIAKFLGATGRSQLRWENGQVPVPARVGERVAYLVKSTQQAVAAIVSACTGGGSDTVCTYRTDADYLAATGDTVLSASWHRAVIARVIDQLPHLSVIFWSNPDVTADRPGDSGE